MLDVRIYHAIVRFLPRVTPRWAWRMVGAAIFTLEMRYLGRLRPLIGMASQRFVEYTWILANLKSSKGPILDVGCGDSLLSHQLLRRGYEVYAVDLKPQAGAKKLLGNHFLEADATDLPLPEEFFDQIITISTLEHMKDDVACMRELSRVLKPDGKILITVPLGFSFYDMSTVRRLIIDGLCILREEYYVPEGGKYRKYLSEKADSKVNLLSKPETIVCLVLAREPSQVKSVKVRSDEHADFAEPKKKRNFVCLIGIDGSGKTTQAQALVKALKEEGVNSHYVWNRFEPRLLKPFIILAKMLFFKGKDMGKNYTEYSETKKRIFKNRLLSITYEYLLLFDYLCQTQIEVSLPLMLGRNIICDRYIHDTVVSLAVDMNYFPKKRVRVMRNLSLLAPKPDLILLIDVPAEVAYQRKNEFPLELLMQRRVVYLDIAKEDDIMIVDGNRSPAELESLLLSIVTRELNL